MFASSKKQLCFVICKLRAFKNRTMATLLRNSHHTIQKGFFNNVELFTVRNSSFSLKVDSLLYNTNYVHLVWEFFMVVMNCGKVKVKSITPLMTPFHPK